MSNDETSAPNGAQQPENSEANAGAQRFIKQQNGSPTEEIPGGEEQRSLDSPKPILPIRLWRWLVAWWTNPFRARGNFSEHLTVAVSIVIAVIAFFQWSVYRQQKQIMEGSGAQTQQLIDTAKIQSLSAQTIAGASNRNAAAAESFSTSAEGIKEQTKSAVSQFKSLAVATKSAADTAAKQFTLSLRPWIAVSDLSVSGQEIESANEMKIKISYKVRNYGNVPARSVAVHLLPESSAKYLPEKWTNPRACDPTRGTTKAGKLFTYTIFPTVDGALTKDSEDPVWYSSPGAAISQSWVIVCIAYKDQSGETIHQTKCSAPLRTRHMGPCLK